MITASAPRSNWPRTAAAHCAADPVADGASHSSGISVAMCSSCSVVALDVDRAAEARPPDRIGAEAREHAGIPAVRLDHQVAVGLQVGREAADGLLESSGSGRWSPTVAKHDQTVHRRPGRARRARRRPSPSRTQRCSVSSVKNVCRMTSSNARPPSSSELRPERHESERDVLVERRVEPQHRVRARSGPSWPMIVSPCQSRRMRPAKSSICAVVIRGMPNASNSGAMPRPMPSEKRPPVRRCIVVAYDAVTIGWRVLWFVAPVMICMFVVATRRPRPTA